MSTKIKVKCPVCSRNISLSGMPLHSNKHPEKKDEIMEMVKKFKEEQKAPTITVEPKVEFEKVEDIKKEDVVPSSPSTEVISPKPVVALTVNTDEEFRVIPVIKSITPTSATMVDGKLQVVSQPVLTEDEVTGLLSAVFIMPTMFLPKLPARTPEQIKPFAHELTLYCIKKNINVRDYLFDELGLVLTGVTLGAGMWNDYTKAYPKDTKKQDKVSSKLDADATHRDEVDLKNEAMLKYGLVSKVEIPTTKPDGSKFVEA